MHCQRLFGEPAGAGNIPLGNRHVSQVAQNDADRRCRTRHFVTQRTHLAQRGLLPLPVAIEIPKGQGDVAEDQEGITGAKAKAHLPRDGQAFLDTRR